MKLLAGNLYLTFPELIGYGVPDAYLKKVCSEYRAGLSSSWANVKDERPGHRRECLIAYDSIPDQTINKRNIPAKAVLLAQLRAEEDAARIDGQDERILGLLKPVSKADMDTLRNVRRGRAMADSTTGEIVPREQLGLPAQKLRELAEQCRWLALISDPKWKIKGERQGVGIDSLKELQLTMVEVAAREGVELPTNYSKLQAKIREYRDKGAEGIVPKSYGLQNARKVDEAVLEYLISKYASKQKPDFTKVWCWYEQDRQRYGWPELSVGAIKNNLYAPDIKPTWYLGRHGVEAWRKEYEYTVQRFRPTFRDALWVLDGTKVNYFYRAKNAKGKEVVSAKLNVVAVLDAHSDFILGWAFGLKENADVVAAALRMACERSGGIVPAQILSDNGGPNKRVAESWKAVGLWTLAQPNNGQSKVIESAFGRLQNHVMRANPQFTGQNITAKSLESEANDALMEELVKSGKGLKALWTLEEAQEQAEKDLHVWNRLAQKKDGKTPHDRYFSSEHPYDLRTLTAQDEADLFWVWNDLPIQHRRDGLTMTHQGERFTYEVTTAEGLPDVAFWQRWGSWMFEVKYDPINPGAAVALYTGERRFVALACAKRAMPMAIADYQQGDGAAVKARLVVKRNQRTAHEEKLRSIEDRQGDAEETVKLGHRWVSKETLDQAEADMYTQRWTKDATDSEPEAALVPVAAPQPQADTLQSANYARFLRLQQQQNDAENGFTTP